MVQIILTSHWKMKDAIKRATRLNIKTEDVGPVEMLDSLNDSRDTMWHMATDHACTSSASNGTQLIAMSILMEDALGKITHTHRERERERERDKDTPTHTYRTFNQRT
jgi:hypothetical protein